MSGTPGTLATAAPAAFSPPSSASSPTVRTPDALPPDTPPDTPPNPPPNPPLLNVAALRVAFGDVEVVHGIDLEVRAGENVALVGESGSGKSVTALAALGLLPPRTRVRGRIEFEGTDLLDTTPEALRRVRGAGIGMVFQEPMTSLTPVLTVGRQLTEALGAHRELGSSEARRAAIDMLDAVGIPNAAERLGQYPHEFSGGMRQRVMLAMAMLMRPRLLIADEPTTALDVTVQAQVLELMGRLTAEHGTALLLITHDMGVVAEVAERTVVLRGGHVVEAAPTAALFARPSAAYTRELLAAVPSLGTRSLAVASRYVPRAPAEERAEERTGHVALALTNVRKSFAARGGLFATRRRTLVLAGVSLEVAAGETVALVGESGCGKSTLGRVAAGILAPDSGHVDVNGESLESARGAARRQLRRRVQMVFQDPFASLDPRRTIGETVTEPLIVGGTARGEARERALEWLDEVGLPPRAAARLPHAFSGGQRQRVAIARAMVTSPSVLIADEPTSALDVSVQARILELFERLRDEHRVACLFVTHDLAVARRIAHRVAVMRAGRLVELGPTDAVVDAPHHPYTRALLSAVPVPDPARRGRARGPVPAADADGATWTEVEAGHFVRGHTGREHVA